MDISFLPGVQFDYTTNLSKKMQPAEKSRRDLSLRRGGVLSCDQKWMPSPSLSSLSGINRRSNTVLKYCPDSYGASVLSFPEGKDNAAAYSVESE